MGFIGKASIGKHVKSLRVDAREPRDISIGFLLGRFRGCRFIYFVKDTRIGGCVGRWGKRRRGISYIQAGRTEDKLSKPRLRLTVSEC